MKKLLLIFILLSSFLFLPFITFGANCDLKVDDINDVGESLNTCLTDSNLVNGRSADISGTGGFQKNINKWVGNLATFFGIIAVGAIVYGGILMTLSGGEEEKIKKAKNIVKWGIIGFLGIISASTIIVLVVNIMYSLEI